MTTDHEYVSRMRDGYIECALWAGLDWGSSPEDEPTALDERFSVDDISPAALVEIYEDCQAFYEANFDDLADWNPEQAGHDFYLTRNRHGAGFWDRG